MTCMVCITQGKAPLKLGKVLQWALRVRKVPEGKSGGEDFTREGEEGFFGWGSSFSSPAQ